MVWPRPSAARVVASASPRANSWSCRTSGVRASDRRHRDTQEATRSTGRSRRSPRRAGLRSAHSHRTATPTATLQGRHRGAPPSSGTCQHGSIGSPAVRSAAIPKARTTTGLKYQPGQWFTDLMQVHTDLMRKGALRLRGLTEDINRYADKCANYAGATAPGSILRTSHFSPLPAVRP
jgi:hypothetical protein